MKGKILSYDEIKARMYENPTEYLLALDIMDNNGDTIAYFGINGNFLYSE